MNSPFMVTPQWLSEHLHQPDIAIVDARMSPMGQLPKLNMLAEFAAGHIPGAVFFDIDEVVDKQTTLPHMLPSADQFSAVAGQLGISDQQKIVVYDEGNLFSAPRAWWTFRVFGARQVYVLDGGLNQWKQQGHALELGAATPQPQRFNASFDPSRVKKAAEVLQAIDSGEAQILDARSAARFYGDAPEPRPGLRSGHMPTSINIPYTDLLAEGRFKSLTALRKTFLDKGVDLNAPIIVSCGSGVTAAVLALGLHSLDAAEVMLYDGSWSEWGASDRLPIESK